MQVKSKSGRMFDIPSPEQEVRIQAGIDADPDTVELSDEQMSHLHPLRAPGRPRAAATKQPISIRLSPDVVSYFKSTGKGWQTRMDAVLKEYVEAHR